MESELTLNNCFKLRANQRFLALELIQRGIAVSVLDWENEVLEATHCDKRELFVDIDSSIMPFAASTISSSKPITKYLLERNNIAVPVGKAFALDDIENIFNYARQILPELIVVKPSVGNQGEGVYVGIESFQELECALRKISEGHGVIQVMLEKYYRGSEYRVFITETGEYAVLLRDPAHVIGDGKSSILELAEIETERRTNPRVNCLCPILLDENAEIFLKKQGLTFGSVPKKNEKVYVRGNSNIKTGGVAIDYTDYVHPSVIDICKRALAAIPSLPYAGIDFLSRDITKTQTQDSYVALEINSLPGIGMHIAPGRGQSRNVAKMIVDIIFGATNHD